MGSYAEHQQILGRAFLKAAEAFPDALIFSRHTGKFLNLRFVDALRAAYPNLHEVLKVINNHSRYLLSVSMKGQADSYMVLPITILYSGLPQTFSVHIEAEVKSGDAEESKDQKNWEKSCELAGILYILVRHEDDIVSAIKAKWPWIS